MRRPQTDSPSNFQMKPQFANNNLSRHINALLLQTKVYNTAKLLFPLGGSPALRAAPGRGQAVQGCATLPCCAPLPLVAPFPSLPHPLDTMVSERNFVSRSGPPPCTPPADAALRSSLLPSLFTTLAAAPVAAVSRPPLPHTHRTRPAQCRFVGSASLRQLRFIRPATLPQIQLQQHAATCRPPTHKPPGASGHGIHATIDAIT